MTVQSSVIRINRGTDRQWDFVWPKADGTPADLTGFTSDIYDVHPILQPHVTFTILDAAAGRVRIRINWSDTFPLGNIMFFRLRLRIASADPANPTDTTSNLIQIEVR